MVEERERRGWMEVQPESWSSRQRAEHDPDDESAVSGIRDQRHVSIRCERAGRERESQKNNGLQQNEICNASTSCASTKLNN